MVKRRVLFKMSGSIACYKACQIVSRLMQTGHEVQVACTRGALQFIGEATLEGLTGRPVFSDTYERARMMDHIELGRWAEVAILCPATAHTLNRFAAGLGDDAVGSLFLAYDLAKKPYLIAPAMNQGMLQHPATREALGKLAAWGVRVISSEEGWQACGDIGPGRLAAPDFIYREIIEALK
ncbi:MAG TPA: flavoprotein [Bdellovibrionota bacterium]|nr:flavoprotein [Bdellovibrionota bacterium]